MKALEWRNVDKSAWGPGPWQDEPDAAQWRDEATGLPCLARRSETSGSLCGYVGVVEGHPAFEKEYEYGGLDFSVHGGLTYAGFCFGEPGEGICHLPEPGEPERVWWFGFDCAHCFDLSPRMRSRLPRALIDDEEIYRDLDYVKAECARLAQQLNEQAK